MLSHRLVQSAIAAFLVSILCLALPAQAALDYTAGHADLGVGYSGGAWDIHFHAEGAVVGGVVYPDQEFEPDEVRILVPLSTLVTGSPPGAPFISDFWDIPESLGVTQGTPFYNLFQNLADAAASSSPYLGIGADEIDSADFVGGKISIALTAFSGPGQFTLWQDGNGVKFDTFDGIGGDDVLGDFPTGPGAHSHFNYAFSLPGVYRVTITASGTLADSRQFTSGSGTFTFVVVPETSTLALAAAGCLTALAAISRKRFSHHSA